MLYVNVNACLGYTKPMTKPAIIMIHGFRGTHHGLGLIASHLKDVSLHIPDLPGFAEGDMLHTYDLDAYVEWLHGYVLALNLKTPPFLLGHSFGSIVCAAYAARYPDTIEKLILVNPIGAPALEGPRSVLTKLAIFYYWLGKYLPRPLAHAWLSSTASVMIMSTVMAKTKDKTLRRYIHNQHRRYFSLFHSPKSVYEGFVTSVSNTVKDVATSIALPTLLIAGERDDITTVEQQKILHEQFPNAKLEIIAAVGHLTHYETPKEVADFVQAFIKSE